jgi:hypothetical protein
MPALSNFFALDALITPGWILLGTAIGIHALSGSKMSGRRKLGIAAYVIFGVLLIGMSWWRGAWQVEQAMLLAQATHAQPSQSVNEMIGAATTKFQELEATLKQTRDELTSLEVERQEERKPRRLTEEQKATLKSALAPMSTILTHIVVNTINFDGEAYQYANDFIKFFKDAGIDPIGPVYVNPASDESCCVVVAVKDLSKVPDAAMKLEIALRASNIADVGVGMLDTLSDADSFQLIIGSKRKH